MIEEILEINGANAEYKTRMRELQGELALSAKKLREEGRSLLVVFEGFDASGKSGCIRRLTRELDSKQYRIVPVGPPTDMEKRYHYLYRFWRELPMKGEIAFFDRSWYGRVLVERVEGFSSGTEWRRAYREINEFERLLTDDGAVVLKYWLEVSEGEQLRRFRARMENPEKAHKITEDDWRNRSKRAAYEIARDDMLRMTDTQSAPWRVIPADDKKTARIAVAEDVIYNMNLPLQT